MRVCVYACLRAGLYIAVLGLFLKILRSKGTTLIYEGFTFKSFSSNDSDDDDLSQWLAHAAK